MSTPLIRSADIAALANVSRAAVTQWRKRHNDFPAPATGPDADTPLFDRDEVERWLIRSGRLAEQQDKVTPAVVAETVLGHLRASGMQDDGALAGAALVAEYLVRGIAEKYEFVGAAESLTGAARLARQLADVQATGTAEDRLHTLATQAPDIAPALDGLNAAQPETDTLLRAVSSAVAPLSIDKFLEVYDVLLRNDRRHTLIDPQPVSTFVADMVECSGVLGDGGIVLDPAVGPGATLLTLGIRHPSAHLIGADISADLGKIALQRAILANRPVDLRVGNSLGTDPASEVLADVVVATPPWGLRDFGPDVDVHDPRWAFGRPSPRSDGIWLQHAIAHLADGGRAFVVTPRGELDRFGPPHALRQELLRQGAIEAVITLPARLFSPYTAIETALWVLARPGQTVDKDGVLLIDVPTGGESETSVDGFSGVLAEYEHCRTSAGAGDMPYSVVVPVRDLLDPNTGLDPATWIRRRDAPSPEETIESITAAHASLTRGSTRPVEIAIPGFTPAGMVRRERLTSLPGVHLVRSRPTPSREHAEDNGKSGAPLLTGRVFHEYLTTGVATPDRYVTDDQSAGVTTQPGDIVILGIARPNRPIAARFDLPGWVVAPQNYLVRIDSDAAATHDPDYLVTCINAAAHTLPRTMDTVRVIPRNIEIPVVPRAEQQRIVSLNHDLADATTAAEERLAQLRALATLVETATGTGTISITS